MMDRTKQFVLEFVSISRKHKEQFVGRWQEVLENFVVNPANDLDVDVPYRNKTTRNATGRNSRIILKDAETHKAVMTFASKLVTSVIGDPRYEYVQARPVGYEDADKKAQTVSKLLRYDFSLPGVFRTLVEAVVDMLLFGTSVLEVGWRYETREIPVREVEALDGVEADIVTRQEVVAWDDPLISTVDPQDWFYDPSEYRLENMSGVAKRFEMTAMRARDMAAKGIYEKAAVERAISGQIKSHTRDDGRGQDIRENIDQPDGDESHSDFKKMIGYEYWGDVPDDDGNSERRVVTILNDELVRNDEYPFADPELPFVALTINPVQGRFYGISPAEVIRYDQDLMDALKGLLAEAVIKQVRPPHIYNKDAEVDLAKLFNWKPDGHIGVMGDPSNAVSTVQYGANVFSGFQFGNELRQGMQQASGALGLLQGTGLGVNRASATEVQFSAQNALDRPELAAMILERDAMPRIARALLRRNQQFIFDTEDLAMRVGELPQAAWIGDIMGDFDVQFVGSRIAMTRQERMQAYDRLVAMSAAIPAAQAMIPWQLLLQRIIGEDLELPEVAAMIADPAQLRQNIILQQILQAKQTGNGNGTTQLGEPPGALPAQVAGGPLG